MSGPKDYTYTPPPPPPPPVYYTTEHTVGSHDEAAETLAVIGRVAGVSIRVQGGKIIARFSENSGWSYSRLEALVKDAKEKAQRNLAYVREYVKNTLKSIDEAIKKSNDVYTQNLQNIDQSIAKLEALKSKISTSLKTPEKTFNCDEEIKKIEAEIAKLTAEKRKIINEHDKKIKDAELYKRNLSAVKTTAELQNVEKYRPVVVEAPVDPSIEVDQLKDKIDETYAILVAFVEAANKLYDFLKKENLNEYKVRLDDKVAALNPRDPKSLKDLDKLVNDIIQEAKFIQSDQENQKAAKENVSKTNQQLEELQKISKTLKPIIYKLEESGHDVADVTDMNKEMINKIDIVIDQISSLKFLSRENTNNLLVIKEQIARLKNLNLNNPRISVELNRITNEVTKLLENASKEDEKYDEYLKALEEYLKVRSKLIGLSEDGGDIIDLSKNAFNLQTADRLIEQLRKDTAEMNKIIDEIMGRSLINSMATAVGDERVFIKEEKDGKPSFSFVRKENKGVIYQVEQTDTGACITPRGVVLSNGMQVISEEELRKVHSSCEWSIEMNERLINAGMPGFTATERGKEATEALYDIDNYYHIESDEESIRYLRLCGYSDEEIKNVFHYDTVRLTRIDDKKESHHERKESKELDDKD